MKGKQERSWDVRKGACSKAAGEVKYQKERRRLEGVYNRQSLRVESALPQERLGWLAPMINRHSRDNRSSLPTSPDMRMESNCGPPSLSR